MTWPLWRRPVHKICSTLRAKYEIGNLKTSTTKAFLVQPWIQSVNMWQFLFLRYYMPIHLNYASTTRMTTMTTTMTTTTKMKATTKTATTTMTMMTTTMTVMTMTATTIIAREDMTQESYCFLAPIRYSDLRFSLTRLNRPLEMASGQNFWPDSLKISFKKATAHCLRSEFLIWDFFFKSSWDGLSSEFLTRFSSWLSHKFLMTFSWQSLDIWIGHGLCRIDWIWIYIYESQ